VSVSMSGFSVGRRSPAAKLIRLTLRLLLLGAIVAAGWGLTAGALWAYANSQLQGVPIAALREDVLLLGASGARAPEDATTMLVLLVEPLDPTVRRPSALAGPPLIVQVGAGRERPAALVLPLSLEVTIDGSGVIPLEQVQREFGADRLAQALIDYTEIRLDHVLVISTEVLPGLIRILGPLEVCGARGCSEPTPDDVRAWQRDPDPREAIARSADVLRAVAARTDRAMFLGSPLEGKRIVDLLASQMVTDVDLGLGRLLALAPGASEPQRIDIDSLPLVRNPMTGEMVLLEESAMVRFQRLRDGTAFDDIDPAQDVQRLQSIIEVGVLNGAGVPGLAVLAQAELRSAGFQVIGTGNDSRFDRTTTVINYRRGDRDAEPVAFLLLELLDGAVIEPVDRPLELDGQPVGIMVVLGRDRVTDTGGRDGSG